MCIRQPHFHFKDIFHERDIPFGEITISLNRCDNIIVVLLYLYTYNII